MSLKATEFCFSVLIPLEAEIQDVHEVLIRLMMCHNMLIWLA